MKGSIQIQNQLVLIGAGNMGGALLNGWIENGLPPEKIAIFDPSPGASAATLIREHGLLHNPLLSMSDHADAVVFAVKPQIIDETIEAYKGLFSAGAPLISIVAGISIGHYLRLSGDNPVIRCMPNTPAVIGRGITVCHRSPECPENLKNMAETLFQAVGSVVWIQDESQFDTITALSGSGPAYVFLLTECLTEAGCRGGLDRRLAERLARSVIGGSGALIRSSMKDPEQLRREVTSPGGVTEAALEVLMRDDRMVEMFVEAVTAGRLRSKELDATRT